MLLSGSAQEFDQNMVQTEYHTYLTSVGTSEVQSHHHCRTRSPRGKAIGLFHRSLSLLFDSCTRKNVINDDSIPQHFIGESQHPRRDDQINSSEIWTQTTGLTRPCLEAVFFKLLRILGAEDTLGVDLNYTEMVSMVSLGSRLESFCEALRTVSLVNSSWFRTQSAI